MPILKANRRDPELTTSHRFAEKQRPHDSATLIVVRHDDNVPRVLLGQRHGSHAFMPNMFVFPGGRLDPADLRTKVAADLHPLVHEKLLQRMRGRTSPSRARGLAVAAIRETYEETGLFLGNIPQDARLETEDWDAILSAADLDLSSLRLFARAITPPGRTRRFDSRFFVTSAVHIGNLDNPRHPGSGELLTPHWFSFAEALELELPMITRDTLKRLQPLMEKDRDLPADQSVCFQYFKGKSWREDML
jgi:8-oxo-dGTP pyrophosphatase MutT (NUDIX family)